MTRKSLFTSWKTGFAEACKRQEEALSGVVLCLVIFLIFTWVYNLTTILAWQTPLVYGGDAQVIWGLAKAFMDGDIVPVVHKWVAHLNAPFSANWNDYPMTEEFIYATIGWLGRFIGLFAASNVLLLLAHLLAGLAFWYVGRCLKYQPEFVFAGALLFAFSTYIFVRNFGHISLSYYWHVPLMLMVSWWAYSSTSIKFKSRKWLFAIGVAAISGLFNPYYTGMFLQFIGFAVLLHLARKQYHLIKFSLSLVGVTVVSFLVVNLDTLSYAALHGANSQAVARNFAALEIYALKIPELLFPPAYHRWGAWAEYGQSHYFLRTVLEGEKGQYLGLMGLVGLVWLLASGMYRLLKGKTQLIPVPAWQALWVLLFSLAGGINLLLGAFDFMLFRGTNRYSIFILAIALLFLVRQLSRKCPGKLVLPIAIGMVAIGLWDQLPPKFSAERIQQTANSVQADRNFAEQLEARVPQNSLIFQLPVVAFPEIPPIYQMADYENFRPYYFTRNLHYSYGTNKGRGDANWQTDLSKLTPAGMVEQLESYGFAAIIINRKGYADKGVSLITEIAATNRIVLADSGELIAIRLKPAAEPVLPQRSHIYRVGWSGDEGGNRWAISNSAEIGIFNNSNKPKLVVIEFALMTLKPRNVEIAVNGKVIDVQFLDNTRETQFQFDSVTLQPGENTLLIETDVSPDKPGTADSRELSFRINNLKIKTMP